MQGTWVPSLVRELRSHMHAVNKAGEHMWLGELQPQRHHKVGRAGFAAEMWYSLATNTGASAGFLHLQSMFGINTLSVGWNFEIAWLSCASQPSCTQWPQYPLMNLAWIHYCQTGCKMGDFLFFVHLEHLLVGILRSVKGSSLISLVLCSGKRRSSVGWPHLG